MSLFVEEVKLFEKYEYNYLAVTAAWQRKQQRFDHLRSHHFDSAMCHVDVVVVGALHFEEEHLEDEGLDEGYHPMRPNSRNHLHLNSVAIVHLAYAML